MEACPDAFGEYVVDHDTHTWTLGPTTCDGAQAEPSGTIVLDALCYE